MFSVGDIVIYKGTEYIISSINYKEKICTIGIPEADNVTRQFITVGFSQIKLQ